MRRAPVGHVLFAVTHAGLEESIAAPPATHRLKVRRSASLSTIGLSTE